MALRQVTTLPALPVPGAGLPQEDSFIRDFFGLTQQEFMGASPQTLRTQLNVRQGAPFDPQTGLPLRPARTLQEAANFEFAQNLFVNRLAQANQARAAAAIQAQIGLVQRGGPGSLQQLLSPAFTTLANILGTTTFQPFDFTAGVVDPRVGGRRRGRRRGPAQPFGGISDPFGGRSIQEFAQQAFGGPAQDISDIGRQVVPSGAPPLSFQDQIVQQFDQFGQAPFAQPQADISGARLPSDLDIFDLFGLQDPPLLEEFGETAAGRFGIGFDELFGPSPFAAPELSLPGFAPTPGIEEFEPEADLEIEQFLSGALGI